MPLTLTLLRQDLRDHLGVDDSDLIDADADRLLNRSWWTMAAQLRFSEKDAEFSFSTVASQQSYALPTDSDAVERVVIKDLDTGSWEPLTKIDDWNMFEKQDEDEDQIPAYYSRRGSEFILWPIPDDAYDVRVKYQQTLADLQASGPGVPQEWHEVILWGAVSRGFFKLGDWARGKEAQNQQAVFLQSLSTQEERETIDRSMSGFKIVKRRYP